MRSYYHNFDHLLILLAGNKVNLDFIILSEAWLDADKQITFVDLYIPFATTDNRNRNDGAVYVKADICVDCKQVSLGQTTELHLKFKYNKQYYNLLPINRSPSMDLDHFFYRYL